MKRRQLFSRKSLWRNDRGNALALTALAFPLVVGSAGLAVDTTQWVLTKRQIQQVADAAALAGSNAAVQGADVDYAVDRAVAPLYAKIAGLTAQSTLSPEDYDGDPYAVGVRLATTGSLPFSSMFLRRPITISARAIATVIHAGNYCAFALGSSLETGITLQPDSVVETDCGFATNSSGPQAVAADVSSRMAVPRLLAFGGISGGTALSGSPARGYSLRQKDPLANVEVPPVPNSGCPNVTVNADSRRSLTLKPGCYGNLMIDGRVTLEPGNYILNRGNLILGSEADLSCDGCTIFLTSEDASSQSGSVGRVQIDKEATLELSAPSDGPYAGIVLFQDRRAGPESEDDENILSGNSKSKIEGVVYFPSQSVKVSGTGSSNFNCARIIGRRLIFDGRVMIAKGCSTDTGKIALTGAEVRLVD